ncbi:sce7726 family protein [Parasphaerochaeta coccoides]|uniref:Phage-related protein n=1 Tax=Parasphaerochaeta coccoides (strain ATCC BAA-1237 / DSM 17374 / SPN1) TaxID=760011 RepID=F4GHE9_PARC1|nr:sce7726 family protein [Parasphaerochaeta coccoides]AEC02048.1 putative phage-related protein [Parasphaerochaeta coccoides DSM 17374]
MLKDIDIRASLFEIIAKKNKNTEYRMIPEMAVCDGFARVDVAVANGKLCGYEIKSDADTLERLGSQQIYYDQTFDEVYIVIGKKFSETIDSIVPEWWGIYSACEKKDGKVIIRKVRPATLNPKVDAQALLDLLWYEELKAFLKNNGIKGYSGKNRRVLRQMIATQFDLSTIKNFTRETLKHRLDWRTT